MTKITVFRVLMGVAASTTLLGTMVAIGQTPPDANPPAKSDTAQKPADATDKQTSKLVLKETPFSFPDPVFKSPVAVFEAVGMSNKPEEKKLYLSPICQVVPWDKAGKVRYQSHGEANGRTVFSFRLLNYHEDMFAQAAERIFALHKVKFAPTQFAMMPFSMAAFKIKAGGAEYVSTLGDLDQFLTLPFTMTTQFEVPDAAAELIKRAADSDGGLHITGTLMFNAIGLKRRVESVTFENLQQTDLGRSINSGGAGFYAVDQVQNMITDGAIRQGIYSFEDPGMPAEVATKGRAVFDKAMQDTAEKVVLKHQEDFRAADEAERRASGITAKDFMPMELRYKYQSEVLAETSFEKANKNAEEYYKREKTSLSASVKGRYGPVSGRASYSRDTDKWEHKKFENQESFDEHKKDWMAKQGDGVEFKPRGLNLVEKGALKRALSVTSTALTVRPVAEAGKLAVFTNTANTSGGFAERLDIELKELSQLRTTVAEMQAKTDLLGVRLRPGSVIGKSLIIKGSDGEWILLDGGGVSYWDKDFTSQLGNIKMK
jgi:hypothetical protein